ncbi:MAG: hypothetical protein GY756_08230 [bacterium]|nr:hypothetical protein [bacterium]
MNIKKIAKKLREIFKAGYVIYGDLQIIGCKTFSNELNKKEKCEKCRFAIST